MSAPPPPPPHGEMPRSGGLPPGKYDIFVIPEHSAGSGFLYLPSLQPNVNSFVAGFASALILVALCQSMAPAFRAWWDSFQGLGNMGITLLIVGVGFGAWALGRTQNDSGSSSSSKPNPSSPPPPNSGPSAGPAPGGYASTPPPNEAPPPPPPPNAGPEKPQSSWQRPPPQTGNKRPENPKPSAKGSWEKARDEMRKKEEERKAKEAEQKRRDDLAKRLAELRAKEAKERLEREKEKQRKEKEIADKKEKEAKAAEAKAAAAKAAEAKTAAEKAKAAAPAPSQAPTQTPSPTANRAGSSYAYSGVGEKMSMWPNGKPPAPSSPTPKAPPSPPKKPPAPTARTFVSTDEDAFSYRPYDKPRRPQRRNSGGSMVSDGSWAPSHTTARTSPPPSMRGPYTTKDPDKIVIQAVYLFMNQYAKTPASQLISGVGSVTDGLILRITTEGLFIDDDVRGVPQREWDVKAWTLKLVEVWCPPHCLNSASASIPNPNNKSANLLYKMATGRARAADRDPNKPFVGEEADVYLTDMLKACKDCCRLGLCEQKFGKTNTPSTGQSGEWKARGLHLLRATVRDQDGKRYLFVIDETEHWKVGASLQRLRRGAQARQLGVCSMTASEAKNSLETLGWAA
ncbi:hypothetical protein LEL_08086 [Akanthomyces lecanii RCEF 1005]|uniref:Proline-rich protein RiP-15 n=1 Tax=Akanthomyces lecanii RCEF 1005 TaxID=1081108 RepID=A0A168F0U6_CORDF|nr:hypothetical protein LEL_08086 [Akanthomyces lecanii RCEF 1005]